MSDATWPTATNDSPSAVVKGTRVGILTSRDVVAPSGYQRVEPFADERQTDCLNSFQRRFYDPRDFTMDCTQEILHWLARNDLQELSERFQNHKITTLRRLYCLNVNLIRELIPEIGLRMDFIECWTQFKLNGTLRENSELNGQNFPGRSSIMYQSPRMVASSQDGPQRLVATTQDGPQRIVAASQDGPQRIVATSHEVSQRVCSTSQEMPLEIVEVHSSNQNSNVEIVEYPARPNLPYLQRINVAIPTLQSRSIGYNIPPRVVGNQQQNSVELVEIDNTEDINSRDDYSRKHIISIQDPRSIGSNSDENPFEMILGQSAEINNFNRDVPQTQSNQAPNSEQYSTNSRLQTGDHYRLLSPEVQSEGTTDSGWGSSSSPAQTNPKKVTSRKKPGPKGKRKAEIIAATEEKRQATINSYELLRALDMREFLLGCDAKTKTAVEYYEAHGTLTDPDRSAVCNAVAKMLMKNNIISAAEYHLAAQKICEVFPSECEVLYYCPPDITKKKPSGKLVNKVKNIKHCKNQMK